jgi:hypothetical protein
MSLKGFSSTAFYQSLLTEIGTLKQELSAILENDSELTEIYRAQGGIRAMSVLEDRIEQADHEPEPGTEPDYR